MPYLGIFKLKIKKPISYLIQAPLNFSKLLVLSKNSNRET